MTHRMFFPSKFFLLLLPFLLATLCFAQLAPSPDNSGPSPNVNLSLDDALKRIAYSIHGFSAREPETLAALEFLKTQAAQAVTRIRHDYTTKDFLASLTPTANEEDKSARHPFAMMIVTLGLLENNNANDLLGQWYIELQQLRVENANSTKPVDELRRHQFLILHHLSGRYIDVVAQSILQRLPNMELNERQLSLVYLVTSSKGQEQTVADLKKLSDANAELAKDSFMQQTLKVLTDNQ